MLTLLDTTLRDGSYVVDFQFTATDTALIAGALDACGVPLIEVGHGIGVRAGSLPSSRSACTDREYAEAAAGAVTRGKWGMFCIPGIAHLDDIDMLADTGAGFVRIGTNVTSVAEAAPFIARAKQRGLWVSANFMKTYALDPVGVALEARRAEEFGADLVCIVDSAGGMLPDDVAAYAEAMRTTMTGPIGFHGHDNLGLAVANTLRAVQAGVTVIDTSLRGMGRSAGNACTEMVLFALKRQGVELGIDPIAMLTIAEQRIDPMLRTHQARDSIGIVSGYAQFHSSFLDRIYDAANRHAIDARALIVAVSGDDKINAPVELVEAHAIRIAESESPALNTSVSLPQSRSSLHGTLADQSAQVARHAHSLARRRGKRTGFTIVQSWREPDRSMVFASVHEGSQFVLASAEVSCANDALQVANAVAPFVDMILLDADQKRAESASIIASVSRRADDTLAVLTYSDIDAWARSIVHLVCAELGAAMRPLSVRLYVGDDRRSRLGALVASLLSLRAIVVHRSPVHSASLLVVCAPLPVADATEWVDGITHVIDGWIGALPMAMLDHAHRSGVPIQRVDMRAVMQAEMSMALDLHELREKGRGVSTMDGVAVAAGGIVAPRGTVILDSLRVPSQVFGVADGRGLLVHSAALDDIEAHAMQRMQRRVALVGN